MKKRARTPDMEPAPFYCFDETAVYGCYPDDQAEAAYLAELAKANHMVVRHTPVFVEDVLPYLVTTFNHTDGEFETRVMFAVIPEEATAIMFPPVIGSTNHGCVRVSQGLIEAHDDHVSLHKAMRAFLTTGMREPNDR